MMNPNDIPYADIEMRKRRPVLSTSDVEMYAPMSWIIPTTILDISGESRDPDFSKIDETMNRRAKTPENCSKYKRPTPIRRTFNAGFVAVK